MSRAKSQGTMDKLLLPKLLVGDKGEKDTPTLTLG